MIIIIDGYNVLKQLHGLNVSDMQKSAFVNLLGRYIKKRNHKVIVVFDGGPHRYPDKEKQKGVAVWHSGELQSADDLIIAYAQEHRTKELLVVTLDREICKKVGESRAETVDPFFFYAKIQEVCNPLRLAASSDVTGIYKLSEEENEEVDALMREAAGMKVPLKDEEESAVRKQTSPSSRSSKKERAYLRAIDKL